jgi:hypothetical protein
MNGTSSRAVGRHVGRFGFNQADLKETYHLRGVHVFRKDCAAQATSSTGAAQAGSVVARNMSCVPAARLLQQRRFFDPAALLVLRSFPRKRKSRTRLWGLRGGLSPPRPIIIPFCAALRIAASGHPFCRLQFEIRRSRDRCLGSLEGYDGSRSRRMDSAQRTKLPFLRCAQRRLVGAPRARLISPRDKRQDRKGDRNGQGNHDRHLSHLGQSSSLLLVRSGVPTLVKRFDLDHRRAEIVADPQRHRRFAIVDEYPPNIA